MTAYCGDDCTCDDTPPCCADEWVAAANLCGCRGSGNTRTPNPTERNPTMPDLDTDTARIVSKLVDLQAHIADLTSQTEALKAELRALPAGDHTINGRPVLRIIPTRRFDPAKALELVPEQLRPECYSTALDSAKVKQFLAPALLDTCMVVNGKPKVVPL